MGPVRVGIACLLLLLAACSNGEAIFFEPPPLPLTRGPQVAQVEPTRAVVAFLTDTPLVAEVE
jgi:hypothetical protein